MARVNLRPEGDERFLYIAHRHWAALLIRSIIPLIVGLLAVLAFTFRALAREPDFLGREPPLLDPLNIFLLVSLVVIAAILAYIYFDWANDVVIVSNKRIVHEDRTLWLSYRYEVIPLDQIQNVNKRVENIFQYVLNYGRVEIQAAGPSSPIVFTRADRPDELQRRVLGEMQREKRSQEEKRLAATVDRRLNNAAPLPPLQTQMQRMLPNRQTPLQLLFPTAPQYQGGNIIWHRHWVVLLKFLIGPVAALIVGLGLAWFLLSNPVLNPVATTSILIGTFLFVLGYFYWQYDNWRNDIYMLEPTRIVDIQRLPFGLYEDRREATLGAIQNVNATSPNIIARIFGYGDVLIETAGAAGNFTFDHVPDPDEVQRAVFEYRERFRWQQRERDWNSTLDIVEMYYQARSRNNPQQP